MNVRLAASACYAVPLCGLLIGCGGERLVGGNGSARVAIPEAPADVSCLSVRAEGAGLTEAPFDVVPGESAEVEVKGLTPGEVAFSAKGYGVSCSRVGPAHVPGWVSDVVMEEVPEGATVDVALSLLRNASALGASAGGEEACRVLGTPCTKGTQCCSLTCAPSPSDPHGPSRCGPGALACVAGETECDGRCANLAANLEHCGACGLGCDALEACVDGACVVACVPVAETCNGQDDDCDGWVDQGNPEGGGSCATGASGRCGEGTLLCQAGRLVCEPNLAATPETCDGTDDDCDGEIDEGNPGGGAACDTGRKGACLFGTLTCTQGVVLCAQDRDPSAEVCDGEDNDCDGLTDEQNPGGGASCTSGLLGQCAAGTTFCIAGGLACVADQKPSGELCDGRDNDCDGQTDEGSPGGGAACDTGQPGVCQAGTETCTCGVLTCVATQSASAELCDGLDNDCDAETDEGNPGGGAACDTGQPGVCQPGTETCTGGALICVSTQGPDAELCDALDNDCDGLTDEDCP